ncbi:MAG: hypothetical protein ACREQ5_21525, partial [Candidatus Dormibacteria bacterium]
PGTPQNGPYCDASVVTCPGQATSTPDPNSLFAPGPTTDTSGGSTDTSGGSTDTSGGSTGTSGGSTASGGTGCDPSTDPTCAASGGSTDNSGGSTDNSGGSTDNSGGTTAPDTGSSPSAAPAGSGGSSSGGSGSQSNSLFGNAPLPAADTPATAATETSLNIWAIVGAGLIVLAVVLSHLVSTIRQRGRRQRAARPA